MARRQILPLGNVGMRRKVDFTGTKARRGLLMTPGSDPFLTSYSSRNPEYCSFHFLEPALRWPRTARNDSGNERTRGN